MARQVYEIVIEGDSGDAVKALGSVEKASKKTEGVLTNVLQGAMMGVGSAALGMAQQIPQAVGELFDLGVSAESAEHRFEAFAGSTEQAAVFLDAFQRATDGTVSKMDAMRSAGKMLQMGLVSNADEMEVMASIATKLGDQTQGAGDRMADFSALLANRSIPRLDNFGISSGKVRARVEELKKAGHDLDEAFKLAVLEQGRISLEKLGDTSESTATKLDRARAGWEDTKAALGEVAVAAAEASGALDAIPERSRNVAKGFESVAEHGYDLATAVGSFGAIFSKDETVIDRYTARMEELAEAEISAEKSIRTNVDSTRQYEQAIIQSIPPIEKVISDTVELTAVQKMAQRKMDELNAEQEDLARQAFGASEALAVETRSIQKLEKASASVSMQMAFSAQFQQREERAKEFAKRREAIEAEHQENLSKLHERGQSRSIRLNEAAEQEKLFDLQFALEQAQRKVNEMTGKERESVRVAKEHALTEAQANFDAQQKLLNDFHAGRLVRAGENVDALIAEENRRKDAALAALEEEGAKQDEMARKQQGQMMLQTFDQWASQKDIAADKAGEMRTAIAKEYGLISEEAATAANIAIREWEEWSSGMGNNTEAVVGFLGNLTSASGKVFDELSELTSREWAVRILYRTRAGLAPPGDPEPEEFGARGGARVSGTSDRLPAVINNNRAYNVTDGRAAAMLIDRDRRQGMNVPMQRMG
jgi:hypothetical protein